MTLHRAALLVIASCNASTATTTVAPHVAPPQPEATKTTPPESDTTIAKRVLDRWNDAHAHRDANALRALYAASVTFYSAHLSAEECVKRKAAAFARTPDYAQSTENVTFLPDGSGGVFVEFSKISTKTTDGFLYIDDGRITAEGDGKETPTVRWNWCVHDTPLSNETFLGVPRAESIGGFKVSPLDAVSNMSRSRHVAELRASHHDARLKVVITGCPHLCALDDPRGPMADPPCENTKGAYGLAIVDWQSGQTIESVEVDAMK